MSEPAIDIPSFALGFTLGVVAALALALAALTALAMDVSFKEQQRVDNPSLAPHPPAP
jgi:hypothetical protein